MDDLRNKRPSIRDLQIDRTSRGGTEAQSRRMPKNRTNKTAQQKKHRPHKRGFSLGWSLFAVVLLIAASVISLPVVFSDTTINIKPVVTKAIFTDAAFNTFLSSSDTTSTDENAGMLTYSVVEWDANAKEVLEPTGREEVKSKASGMITVYNEYTTGKQRLIKNTRFETEDGRVYRVRESIMVPGKTGSTPGTLDVRVYADEAGDSYNLESGNLTLPGLKSLPDMYTDIYAKVKTPISGGFVGERAVVSEESKSLATETLKDRIRENVMSEVQSRIPEDTRYFDTGVYIDFLDTNESEVDGKVEIVESATVRVLVFNKVDFAQTLSMGVAGNPSKGYPIIRDISKLDISLSEQSSDEEADVESIKLIVNGDADFIWNFNQEDLIRDLAGKQREALLTVLTGYPTIDEAEAIIRPFWKSTFPKSPNDFTIEMLGVE